MDGKTHQLKIPTKSPRPSETIIIERHKKPGIISLLQLTIDCSFFSFFMFVLFSSSWRGECGRRFKEEKKKKKLINRTFLRFGMRDHGQKNTLQISIRLRIFPKGFACHEFGLRVVVYSWDYPEAGLREDIYFFLLRGKPDPTLHTPLCAARHFWSK